jgi:hypothetical protein
MAGIQKLICPECKAEFDFDPNSEMKVITSFSTAVNDSFKTLSKKDVTVTAYLECPNGHTNPYKVTKDY